MKKDVKNYVFCLLVLFFLSSTVLFAGQRVYDAHGNIPSELSTSVVNGEQQFNITKDLSKAGNPWTGVGPWGGDVTSIAISPDDSNTMYAAAGDPYISTDGGDSWDIWETLAAYSTSISIIKIASDSIIYACGGISDGLFKSEDSGQTWSQIDNFPITSKTITVVTIDPNNSEVIYVGMGNSGSDSEQIARSTDGGANWQILDTTLLPQSYGITDISINSQDSHQIIVSVAGVFSGGVIIYSDDGGSTWEDVSSGLPTSYPFTSVEIVGNTVYMSGGILYNSQHVGVYKSALDSISWQNISGNFPLPVVTDLIVNPNDTLKIYAATDGDGVYLSSDGGNNWVYTTTGADNFSVNDIVFNPDDLQELFIGCGSMAVYKSNDSGSSWTSANAGMATLNVTDIAVDPNNADNIIASFSADNSGGCYMSNDRGATWYTVDSLPATRYTAVTFDISSNIYACSEGPSTVAQEGVYKSTDGGETWTNTGPNIGSYFETDLLNIEASEVNSNLLFTSGVHYGYGGYAATIYRTNDAGTSDWTEVYTGADYYYVYALEIADSSNQIVYAGYVDFSGGGATGSFLKSTNQGSTWTDINNGIPSGCCQSYTIAVDPQDPDIAYAGCGHYSVGYYIVKTVDGGANWNTLLEVGSYVNCLGIHPDQGSIVYAGVPNTGVLLTQNGGTNWVEANDGFTYSSSVSCFSNCFTVGDTLKMYAGTSSSSAYVTTLASPTYVDISGYVTDAASEAPIDSAVVELYGSDASYSTTTNVMGYYSIDPIVAGVYDITFTAAGYNDASVEDYEILSPSTTCDYEMTAPILSITPQTISDTIGVSHTLTKTITISNTGNGPLTWHNHTDFPDTTYGEIVDQFEITEFPDDYDAFGCTIDGDGYLWIVATAGSSGGDHMIFKYTTDGQYVASYHQNVGVWGLRGIYYLEDDGYIYGGSNEGFHRIDPSTGELTDVFEFSSSFHGLDDFSCIRGLTYVPYLGFVGKDYNSDFAIFDFENNLLGTMTAPDGLGNISGIAYDSIGDCLWLYERGGTNQTVFHEYDIQNQCLTGLSYDMPMLENLTSQRAGEVSVFMDLISGKVVLGATTNNASPYDKFYATVIHPKWVLTDPLYGTLEPGESEELEIYFDATGYNAGEELSCDIVVTSHEPNVGSQIATVDLLVSDVAVGPDTPSDITNLYPNYPNPFSGHTKIQFSLAKQGKVKLSVYNLKGQLVDVLVDDELEAAQSYELTWPVNDSKKQYQSGIYFYKLEAGDYTRINKMIYLK